MFLLASEMTGQKYIFTVPSYDYFTQLHRVMCFKGESLSPEDESARMIESAKNTATTRKLIQKSKEDKQVCKLLLLGSGGCGKSTIFKQMKILHMNGFKEEQSRVFRDILIANVKDIFQTVVFSAQEFNYAIGEEHQGIVKFILDEAMSIKQFPLSEDNVGQLLRLWKDEAIQKTVERRAEYNFLDAYDYLIEHLARIAKKDFVPSVDDILRARSKTTGISEERFTLPDSQGNPMKILMVDVGGQRNERRKWIHAFDGVTLVIYVVGLSEYDQCLEERKEVNRLTEALSLFKDIVNFQGFKKKAFIVFYNKKDLFEKKIKNVDLTVCPDFADYTGGKDYEKALEAIKKKFKANDMSPSRSLTEQVTCATDTKQVETVMKGCTAVITRAYLESLSLL